MSLHRLAVIASMAVALAYAPPAAANMLLIWVAGGGRGGSGPGEAT
jgi:hypothetical protein